MEIAKALILAGRGDDDERPWPTAPRQPRQLFPVANRPLLFHNLEALGAAGILEVMILADGESAGAIRAAVAERGDWGLQVHHAEWHEAAGIGSALHAGRDFLGDEPVLVQQAGALLLERMHVHISAFARERLDALALRLGGGVRATAPGFLLSHRAVSMLLDAPAGAANIVAGVRAQGGRVRVQRVDGCLGCHGGVETLLESNRRMLEGLEPCWEKSSLDDCTVQGAVQVHPTARIERALLRGPVVVGPGARIVDGYVGPYTAIGAGAVVEGSEIEHSIVLADAEIRFVGTRLESSVIGRGARVVRRFDTPSALRLSIGDGAVVALR